MTAATLTLSDFLLARIAEDEAVARAIPVETLNSANTAIDTGDDPWPSESYFAEMFTPAYVLAECEAKRRIVKRFVDQVELFGAAWDAPDDRLWPEYGGGYLLGLREAVQELASVYADHADFRPEWRA